MSGDEIAKAASAHTCVQFAGPFEPVWAAALAFAQSEIRTGLKTATTSFE